MLFVSERKLTQEKIKSKLLEIDFDFLDIFFKKNKKLAKKYFLFMEILLHKSL